MLDKHEPRNEFVEKLEWQIGREARRRKRPANASRWGMQSRLKTFLGAVALMIVSMSIGAAAVAAAYQAENNERRDLLISGYERRAELARQRLTSAIERLKETERRMSLGTAGQESLLEDRVKMAEAQAQLKSIELQLEEIRTTSREPLTDLSSPLIGGRDFISDRIRTEMSVPEAALELERTRLREAEKRLSLGTADVLDVAAARARTVEMEVAVNAFRSKLGIRQRFLSQRVDAVETELRVLESEAAQRQKALAPKVELARKQLDRAKSKVQLGTAQRVELAEATLRLQELEAEIAKAELDLALVRRQLEQRRSVH